jgi:hypothetical protein
MLLTVDQVLQYPFRQHPPTGIQITQGLSQIGRAVFRIQFIDTKTAGAPVHGLLRQVQHPAAQIGDVFGLAEQVTLFEQFIALLAHLTGQVFTRGDVTLQGDKMADAVFIAHGGEGQLVKERLAVLAVIAQHHFTRDTAT